MEKQAEKKSESQKETQKKLHQFIFSKKERSFDPQVTFQQLMVNKNIVFCWGATDFQGAKDHALFFKVRGYKHKGYVVITLGFMDTYDVHLLDWKANQVGETLRDVYCDQLVDVIDALVETK